MLLKVKYFSIKSKGSGILNPYHSKLKILTPKQMLQRLPIAFVQVKATFKHIAATPKLNHLYDLNFLTTKILTITVTYIHIERKCPFVLKNIFERILRKPTWCK